MTIEDIPELLSLYENGTFRERDIIFELERLIATEDVEAILAALPVDWRRRFTAWMFETFDNDTPAGEFIMLDSAIGEVPEGPMIVDRIRAWMRTRYAPR